jgi:ankyrin repeat protein
MSYQYFETFYKLLRKKQAIPQIIIDGLQLNFVYSEPGTGNRVLPVQAAFFKKNYPTLQQLINAGCDLENTSYPYSLLHNAVIYDDLEAIKIVLRSHADVNALTRNHKRTALHLAALWSKKHIEIFWLIVEAGGNLNIKDAYGKTPLDYLKKAKIA